MEQDIRDKFNSLEKKIDLTNEKIEKVEKSTNEKIDKVEERVYNAETSIQLLNTNINNLVKNTDEIKSDVKELKKLRDADHFVKPMEKSEKFRNQILGVAIGFLVSGILTILFPMLK